MKSDAVRHLSPRQLECLRLVAELKKTEQIADELGISPSTVNTHIERATTILGASSRREAALLVLEFEGTGRGKQPTEFQRLPEPTSPQAAAVSPATATWRQRNDLTWIERLVVAIVALALLCIAIGGLGAAVEQLSAWRTSLGHKNHVGAAPAALETY